MSNITQFKHICRMHVEFMNPNVLVVSSVNSTHIPRLCKYLMYVKSNCAWCCLFYCFDEFCRVGMMVLTPDVEGICLETRYSWYKTKFKLVNLKFCFIRSYTYRLYTVVYFVLMFLSYWKIFNEIAALFPVTTM